MHLLLLLVGVLTQSNMHAGIMSLTPSERFHNCGQKSPSNGNYSHWTEPTEIKGTTPSPRTNGLLII
jgi:hypothetical protein